MPGGISSEHIAETILHYLDRHPADRAKLEPVLELVHGEIDLADRNNPHHATAGVALFNPRGQVLLVHHKALDMWVQPGGHIEPGDSRLVDAALRELAEETGIIRDLVRPLLHGPVQIDAGMFPASAGRPAHLHVDFRYAFATDADVATLQSEEIADAQWCDLGDPRLASAGLANLAALLPSVHATRRPPPTRPGGTALTNQQQPAQPEMPAWVEPAVYVDMIENATMYAGFLVTDEAGRVFLMHTSRREHGQRWQSPGGNVEKGATPWDTAREEYEQETGLRFTGEQRLLGVHYLKPGPAWPRGKVGLLFDGGTLTAEQLAAVRLDPREHDRFELHTREEWREILSPVLFHRVDSLMRAKETGCAVYLCDEDLPEVPEQAAGVGAGEAGR